MPKSLKMEKKFVKKNPQNFIKITSFYIVINFTTFILMLPNPATDREHRFVLRNRRWYLK